MPTIAAFLGDDHRRCDNLFAEAELTAARGDFSHAMTAHGAFVASMARHFSMEEEVLFPAFEQASGNTSGPTAIMRHEHRQMRQLFEQMEQTLKHGDSDGFLAASETLLILMQQHNAKEEQILYPMADRLITERAPLIARMEGVTHGQGIG